jgi:hypothetical protein
MTLRDGGEYDERILHVIAGNSSRRTLAISQSGVTGERVLGFLQLQARPASEPAKREYYKLLSLATVATNCMPRLAWGPISHYCFPPHTCIWKMNAICNLY